LQARASDGVEYKVFWLGRHGQGWHNAAELKYGSEEWDRYWSLLTGDGEMTWGPDPRLTPLGESQARAANAAWKAEIPANIPLPRSLYSSPLSRAANTCRITFEDIVIDRDHAPLIVENLREVNGVHTCDKRSTKSQLLAAFPTFRIEPGFSEKDELWEAETRESGEGVRVRARDVLNRIFGGGDAETYISISAHGGLIAEFLWVVGHPGMDNPVGGVIPVVVQATRIEP